MGNIHFVKLPGTTTMLNKIRELVKVQEELQQQQENLRTSLEALNKTLEESRALNESVSKVIQDNAEYSRIIKGMARDFDAIKNDVDNMHTDIKAASAQLKLNISKVIDEQRQIVSKEMESVKNQVREQFSRVAASQEEEAKMLQSLKSLREQINAFMEISGKIKQADFDLAKYADRLKQQDSEKLQLLKRIDELERLLGKERRNRPKPIF